jgi:hypothetical protein
MEMTEDMLRRLVTNITELRLRLGLLTQMVTRQAPMSPQFEETVNKAIQEPVFQQLCDQLFEEITKGGH